MLEYFFKPCTFKVDFFLIQTITLALLGYLEENLLHLKYRFSLKEGFKSNFSVLILIGLQFY